ncbi:hypothetical protein FDI14_gp118 [Mycobacterium phage SirDuracell]|uniref:Uncharacterized protein n=1 Tax=Mycobacterium phage SirDuracell TaxID=1034116 RepID=G1D5Z9_9CAUD|nr:hypothetical protein FDI14_gp118 [Mycobacterium phage SirDuracell]AEK10197.1 hypothetical protein PBI_SIRDURACELL_136 [Mycobacterium phage SirDuracell]
MKTAIEALFQAMCGDGWFTASNGDVESTTGFFSYVTNTPAELGDIRREFSEVIEAYGNPADEEIIGSFVVLEDNLGFIHIERYASDEEARARYSNLEYRYERWLELAEG